MQSNHTFSNHFHLKSLHKKSTYSRSKSQESNILKKKNQRLQRSKSHLKNKKNSIKLPQWVEAELIIEIYQEFTYLENIKKPSLNKKDHNLHNSKFQTRNTISSSISDFSLTQKISPILSNNQEVSDNNSDDSMSEISMIENEVQNSSQILFNSFETTSLENEIMADNITQFIYMEAANNGVKVNFDLGTVVKDIVNLGDDITLEQLKEVFCVIEKSCESYYERYACFKIFENFLL